MPDYSDEKRDYYNGQNNPQTNCWIEQQFRHDEKTSVLLAFWVICHMVKKKVQSRGAYTKNVVFFYRLQILFVPARGRKDLFRFSEVVVVCFVLVTTL